VDESPSFKRLSEKCRQGEDHIGFGPARAAIRVYPIIGWLRVSNEGEPPSFRRLSKGRRQGEDPYRLWACSGGHPDISHYRVAPSIYLSGGSPRGAVRVKTHISGLKCADAQGRYRGW